MYNMINNPILFPSAKSENENNDSFSKNDLSFRFTNSFGREIFQFDQNEDDSFNSYRLLQLEDKDKDNKCQDSDQKKIENCNLNVQEEKKHEDKKGKNSSKKGNISEVITSANTKQNNEFSNKNNQKNEKSKIIKTEEKLLENNIKEKLDNNNEKLLENNNTININNKNNNDNNINNNIEKQNEYLNKKKKRSNEINDNSNIDIKIINKVNIMTLDNIFSFVNNFIRNKYNNNIGKSISEKKFIPINKGKLWHSKVEFDKELLNKKLMDIFSTERNKKYSNYPKGKNQELVQILINDSEKGGEDFKKLFDLTFLDCLKHIRGTEHFDILNGLIQMDDLLNKEVKQDEIDKYKYCISNYENIISDKKPRSSKK